MLALVVAVLPCVCEPVRAEPTQNAPAIVGKALHQRFARTSYEAKIQFTRNDPHFLEKYLAPFESNGLQYALMEGRITWEDPDRYDIYLHPVGRTDLESHFTSRDGFDVQYVPSERFTPGPAPSPGMSPTSAASAPPESPLATGNPMESPSPITAPTSAPLPVDTATPSPYADLYPYHPISMLWPFQLKPSGTDVKYEWYGEEEVVAGQKCWKLERKSSVNMHVWVGQEDGAICQIEYTDPRTEKVNRFQARAFLTIPPSKPDQVPLIVYSSASLLLPSTLPTQMLAEISVASADAFAGTPTPVAEGPSAPVGSGPPKPPPPPTPTFGPFLKVIISALLVGLAYFGGRYLIFLLSRAVFSKEVILVEEPDGALGRALQSLGFSVTPASMEVLTEERNRLGKKPGAVLPRAVVIAPHAIGLIKNYLFLLKAYVEEGGRVLMFEHNASDQPNLPFHAYLVPNTGDGKTLLQARPHLWKRLREEDVETKTVHLLPREYIVEVDHRRPDIDIVQAFNRSTGVRATAVGVARSGKGEYMLCQFLIVDDLRKSKLATSPITRLILLDLVDYLQGRTKEKSSANGKSAES